MQKPQIDAPKWTLTLLNNLYEIEKKLIIHGDNGNASRNVEKIKDILTDEQVFGPGQKFFYEDPLNQVFKETRTDLEATISGESTENLVVTEVFKPIIRYEFNSGNEKYSRVVQKGIVVVESIDNGSK